MRTWKYLILLALITQALIFFSSNFSYLAASAISSLGYAICLAARGSRKADHIELAMITFIVASIFALRHFVSADESFFVYSVLGVMAAIGLFLLWKFYGPHTVKYKDQTDDHGD